MFFYLMFWIKEISRLIWNGMSDVYYWEKLTFRYFDFLEKNIWRNAKTLRIKVYSGERLYWHYRLDLFFVYKIVSQIFLKLFFSEDKRLLLESLHKWGWCQGHNELFPKTSKTYFLDEKAIIKTTLMSSCHWKTLVPFSLWKKGLKTHY